MIVSIDFETWATYPIKFGAWRYLGHPDTKLLMMAWHVAGEPGDPELWLPYMPFPVKLHRLIEQGAKLQGWNSITFERLAWHLIGARDHGFPPVRNDIWLDSMHRAAAHNLPRGLDGAAKAVGAGTQKDFEGHNLMRKLTDGNKTPYPSPEVWGWIQKMIADRYPSVDAGQEPLTRKILDSVFVSVGEKAESTPMKHALEIIRLGAYCCDDVAAEESTVERMGAWPVSGPWIRMREIDRRINDRGILVDLDLVEGLAKATTDEKRRMDERMAFITRENGKSFVSKTTEVQKLKLWLVAHGVELPVKEEVEKQPADETDRLPDGEDDDGPEERKSEKVKYLLRKSDMVDLLARADLPDTVTEAIQLRAWAAKASTGKLEAALGGVCADGRLRQLLTLMGAQQTGRFSSSLFQVHNMPRNPLPDMGEYGFKDKAEAKRAEAGLLAQAVEDGRSGDANRIRAHWGPVMQFASKMLRRCLLAPEGHTLLQGDFSQIEARLAVWFAGQRNIVEAFRRGDDVYTVNAAKALGKRIEDVTPAERQVHGKVTILALTYGGGKQAFAQMAVGYGLKIRADDAQPIVDGHRAANSAIVQFWKNLNESALSAMRYPNREFPVAPLGNISFRYDGHALRMRLPVGRDLTYWAPRIFINDWGREEITFLRVRGKSVMRAKLYGGLMLENACQAACTDALAGALVATVDAGFAVNLHVHDSIAAECPEDRAERLLPVFESAMIQHQSWYGDLPVAADAKFGRRLS